MYDYVSNKNNEGYEVDNNGRILRIIRLTEYENSKDSKEDVEKIKKEVIEKIEILENMYKDAENDGEIGEFNDQIQKKNVFLKYSDMLKDILKEDEKIFYEKYKDIKVDIEYLIGIKKYVEEKKEEELKKIEEWIEQTPDIKNVLLDMKNEFIESDITDESKIKDYLKLKSKYKDIKHNFEIFIKFDFSEFINSFSTIENEKKKNNDLFDETNEYVEYDDYFIKINEKEFSYIYTSDSKNLFELNSNHKILLIFLRNLGKIFIIIQKIF
jgi:hypothetical protein